ncbi:DUF6236 family protein [Nocardia niigatensis]|uniref:DUF6236 family protein n=1 Tax=Nocardia niigatensis TaxID=209249 RepID=UPI0002E928E0|nr:DUF6236 family protein [Nocardia niigatensis]
MSTIALYYPWMRFRNENWLKLAILTWDSVGRIQPRLTMDVDSDLVLQLQSETDFLFGVEPTGRELVAIANVFREIVDLGGDDLSKRYAWRQATEEATGDRHAISGPRRDFPGLVWVHAGQSGPKMARTLLSSFEAADLAVIVDEDDAVYVGLHPALARIYLTALADVVSQHRALAPATDDLDAHSAVGTLDRLYELLLDEEVAVPAIGDVEGAYVHLAVEASIRPDQLPAVSLASLIAFRERYRGELAAFRAHVASLSGELGAIAAIEDPVSAEKHLQSVYNATTKPQLDELQRALRALGVESSIGLLGLKVDISEAAAGTLLGAGATFGMAAGHPAVVAGSVAVGVGSYVADRRKTRRRAHRESPVSYLLAVDREFSGRTLIDRMRRRAPR